jgi:gas vesicle protein
MDKKTEELRTLLKTAGDELRAAAEVTAELSAENERLAHLVQAQGLAIKLASTGHVQASELSEKVAEYQNKSEDDLRMEEKVASYVDQGHRLTGAPGGQPQKTGPLAFIQQQS